MLEVKTCEPDFMYNREAETMSRAAIKDVQAERLRWTLEHVYQNVPHYRRAFDKAGVKPSDLKTAA
ncbi:MAG: phenylacetate--CoA ligase, partial [Rhodobacteraceae bacterium]|nr:phenylacetate--CoA ligase [Paracoccaceae bacterium]